MLKFSHEHIWINVNHGQAGITDYAQKSLGEIVFIELPKVEQVYSKDEKFGSIESAKSVSVLFAPINMKILEINENVVEGPEAINSDPYGQGWLVKVEILEADQLDSLISEGEYLDKYK